jgi:dTDP-4-dehydrorhamnose reductase
MKALVTGLNGTVAPALARAIRAGGGAIAAWDRTVVAIDDEAAGRVLLRRERPDVFFHFATGPADWAERCARLSAEAGIAFVFTSTVSVFGEAQHGPFTPDAEPAPDDDYGRYKLDCERRARMAHPEARVVRLGWQIGTADAGNHMGAFLHRTAREEGQIEASARWLPACSFLDDTAEALVAAVTLPAGLYHLGGNPGLSFFDIAQGLNRLRGEPWTVARTEAPDRDTRLQDGRLPVRPITEHVPTDREPS